MNIHEDDIVRVSNPKILHSGVKGRTGKVITANEDGSCFVQITWPVEGASEFTEQGVLATFDNDELEVVESAYEKDQVRAIAEILHKSGRYDDIPWVEITADAQSLYRAGVRHEG